jgi:hypothetical protein
MQPTERKYSELSILCEFVIIIQRKRKYFLFAMVSVKKRNHNEKSE